ncbi:MAG: efflux RND transporter periplasmic adaptor subunit [Flavobacteriales bacterium]|nr:efflux RND transporter periplasmic adaptor subunit [Flavobacteriales bacterium]
MIRTSLFLSTVLLLTACGGSAPENAPTSATPAAAASEARKVTTLQATAAPFDHFFTVQGNVETDRLAQVFPMTQGTVLRIRVEEGQTVQKGQVLMDLDNEAVARNQDELDTRLTLAKDVLARQERLWEQGIGTEVQLLEARTNVKALEESIAAFSEQVDFGKVTAPFAGTVDRIFAKEGGMASPMQPVARVMDLDDMYVRAKVSDHYVGKVEAGQRVDIAMAGRTTRTSAISRVGRYIEPANRTFEIVVPVPEGTELLPNEFAALHINDLHLDSAISLPSGLILQNREGLDFVYTIQEGKAVRQPVQIGPAADDRVLILKGVVPGMTIIDRGAGQVVEGEAVQIMR